MAYRLTTTLGAAALVLGCLGAPAFAQETATPSSAATADMDNGGKMHHHAMHPKMHGKMHMSKMHGGKSMAEGKSMQGVRSQDMGTDALNNQSLHAAQSNTAFTPGTDSAAAMPGGMHGKMMHGRMMHGSTDNGSMSAPPMGSTGGTMPAQTSGTTGSMGGGTEGNGAMAGSSTGGVGGAAGTPTPKP